ncbi:MAG: DUF2809 domain-containing protein [Clostridia bacterium]|nr:DUF2809 domain-containing protein [Clostridia bacterium]MCQ2479542.1 DUF2809 domain-containing protein [Clostridia bacterium]
MKKRLMWFSFFLLLLATEVVIALYCHDDFIRPYVGDVLVVILLYCLAKAVVLDKMKLLPLWIFIFACLVEVGQYFNYVELLGFSDNPILSTAMGTSFAFEDIVCYFVGCAICAAGQIIYKFIKKKGE